MAASLKLISCSAAEDSGTAEPGSAHCHKLVFVPPGWLPEAYDAAVRGGAQLRCSVEGCAIALGAAFRHCAACDYDECRDCLLASMCAGPVNISIKKEPEVFAAALYELNAMRLSIGKDEAVPTAVIPEMIWAMGVDALKVAGPLQRAFAARALRHAAMLDPKTKGYDLALLLDPNSGAGGKMPGMDAAIPVAADLAESRKLCRVAADLGNPDAMYHLFDMVFEQCSQQRTVSTAERTEAVAWLDKAARAGSTMAMNLTGLMWERGAFGFAQSTSSAVHWYRLAAARGCEDSVASLRKLGYSA
jgi:hypothetical protein